jgi:hypothetical protein
MDRMMVVEGSSPRLAAGGTAGVNRDPRRAAIFKPRFNVGRGVRTVAGWSVVAILIGGGVCLVAVVGGTLQAWNRVVAPFTAMGARVVATGGDDFGRWAGREGVGAIYFDDNVGDTELAALAKPTEKLPNLRVGRHRPTRIPPVSRSHWQSQWHPEIVREQYRAAGSRDRLRCRSVTVEVESACDIVWMLVVRGSVRELVLECDGRPSWGGRD